MKKQGRMADRTETGQGAIGPPRLDLSSLIDVSFLLLIYFLVTSTLDPREADLKMAYQGPPVPSEGGLNWVPEDIEIAVSAEGVISANEEILDADPSQRHLPLLASRMREMKAAFSFGDPRIVPKVVVSADDEVQSQRFVDVMNCLAGVGVQKIELGGFGD